MSTRLSKRQSKWKPGRKNNTPYKRYLTREEIIKLKMGDEIMDGHEQTDPDWKHSDSEVLRTVYWEERCALAEKLLRHVLTNQEIGRACHIHDLETKVKNLQNQITNQREVAEYRNRQLKTANLIVLCSGGCEGGILGSQDKIDEELVGDVEKIARRLRTWLTNYRGRQERKVSPKPPPPPPNETTTKGEPPL